MKIIVKLDIMFKSKVVFKKEDGEYISIPQRFLTNFNINNFKVEECFKGAEFILEKISDKKYKVHKRN